MPSSLMHRELFETPRRLETQRVANAGPIEAVARALADRDPANWYVVGRGTSDHAGAFFCYAAGLLIGRPAGDLSPSLMTVYARRIRFDDAFLVAISQSGAGSDINHVVSRFGETGGLTLAVTNEPESELARGAQYCLALHMGPETAVAATKTFLGTLAALTQLLAEIGACGGLARQLAALPGYLTAVADTPVDRRLELTTLSDFESSMFVIGRGVGLAVAHEIALKFKEVCAIHAEAYSAAEFKHGPLALAGARRPVVVLCLADETRSQLLALCRDISALGSPVRLVGPDLPDMSDQPHIQCSSLAATGSAYTDAVMMTFQLYDALERLAVERGLDPDAPPHITKITSTY